ncbi:MAG: hypothetical protein ACSLE4_04105 [Methyloceanibacter sp.]|uniref:hypothetical protein n=1 Tax=Methyloceanibacter sp. TaxID=1965321 RepID=UPI003EE38304
MKRIDGLSWLRGCGLCALLASLIAVSGCGGGSVSSPFSSSEDTSTGYASERLPDSLPLAESQTQTAAAPAANAVDGKALNCPQVVAWPNERLRTAYQSGHDGDQMFVVSRGEITKLSRDCRFYGGRVVVKYGFAGRVLFGPKGTPGTVTLPVSVRAADAYKSTLAQDKMSVRVTVPPDQTAGYFSMVREISFPIQVGTRLEDYKVFVALK